jgi:hypothetical protein
MPTIDKIKAVCAICGNESKQTILTSSSSFGPPDLDFRPSAPAKIMNKYLIHKCPKCGYCNNNLSEEIPGSFKKIKEPQYKRLLKQWGMPRKAKQFLCHAYLILDSNKKSAFNSYLQASWICDDWFFSTKSERCRRLAISVIEELDPTPNSEEGTIEVLIYIDLLRRVGEFHLAKLECDKLLENNKLPELLKDIVDLQLDLIRNQDREVHRVPVKDKKSDGPQSKENLPPFMDDIDIPDKL